MVEYYQAGNGLTRCGPLKVRTRTYFEKIPISFPSTLFSCFPPQTANKTGTSKVGAISKAQKVQTF